jgi:aspartate/methionine/tyrosine aminotransferase
MSGGGWELAEHLALEGGVLVSPGDLYGQDGADFVRLAVVQPMDRLEAAAARLARRVPTATR